jgi:hypothetical protein
MEGKLFSGINIFLDIGFLWVYPGGVIGFLFFLKG